MSQYPEWLDVYSANNYPSQPPFETFKNYLSLFIQYQTDICDVRDEYLLSNIDYQYETSFA